MPAPMMATSLPAETVSPSLHSNLRARWVMLQKRKSMQPALKRADMVFTMRATCEESWAKSAKNLAVSMKKGAPGGCPTSIFSAVLMNSGQSQKLAVGSMVEQYVKAAMANTSHPNALFTIL